MSQKQDKASGQKGGGGQGGGRGGGNGNPALGGPEQHTQKTQSHVSTLSMIPLQPTFTSVVRDVNADAVTMMNMGTRGGGGPSTILGTGSGTAIFQIHSRHVGVLTVNARRAFSESFISNMAYAEDNAI